jgi:hypothetical protein
MLYNIIYDDCLRPEKDLTVFHIRHFRQKYDA